MTPHGDEKVEANKITKPIFSFIKSLKNEKKLKL